MQKVAGGALGILIILALRFAKWLAPLPHGKVRAQRLSCVGHLQRLVQLEGGGVCRRVRDSLSEVASGSAIAQRRHQIGLDGVLALSAERIRAAGCRPR
jgi:hypothetical protein